MKATAKTILGILLIVIGLFTWLFFRKYTGDLIPFSILWYLVGILLILTGSWLVKSGIKSHDKKVVQDIRAEIENFKSVADKIKVDLNQCKIKINNYSEQVEKEKSYRAQAWDALYDPGKNVETVNINQAVLIFETDRYGQPEKYYSPTLYKDEITLRFYLDKQKETYLYLDRDNRNHYYFDLEFLLG